MQELDEPRMPLLHAWAEFTNDEITEADIALFIVCGFLIVYAIYRWRKFSMEKPQNLVSDKSSMSAEDSLGLSGELSLLHVGKTVTIVLPNQALRFQAKIINLEDHGFTIALPKTDNIAEELKIGEPANILLTVNHKNYRVPATVEKVFKKKLLACTLSHEVPLIFSTITGATPTIFSLLPNNLIDGNYIPLADLHKSILGEIPGNIIETNYDHLLLSTASPINFIIGDLLLLMFMNAETHQEIFLLGALANVVKQHDEENNGQVLKVNLLNFNQTLDPFIEEQRKREKEYLSVE